MTTFTSTSYANSHSESIQESYFNPWTNFQTYQEPNKDKSICTCSKQELMVAGCNCGHIKRYSEKR